MTARVLVALGGLAGCSAYDLSDQAPNDDTGAYGAPGGDTADTATDDLDTGGGDERPPDGWVVHARLSVVGGVAVADGADVRVVFVRGEGDVVCNVPLDPTGVVPEASPEDTVAAWWTVDVVPTVDPCAELPGTLGLGVGDLHASARARLGAVGLDEVADSLFGAYAQADGGPVYVLGYAGTEGDLAGDDAAVAPPPDGTYTLAPLYVLPL